MSVAKIIPVSGVELPEKAVLIRLKTRLKALEESEKRRLRGIMEQAFQYCRFAGCYTTVNLTVEADKVILADQTEWHSAKLADNLRGCSQAVMFGITLGEELTTQTKKLFAAGNSADGVIFDAVGSESVEAAADKLELYLRQQFMRLHLALNPMRFSPGYGNWAITAQQDFFRLLPMEKIGMTLSLQMFMRPEKSITAVIGIATE